MEEEGGKERGDDGEEGKKSYFKELRTRWENDQHYNQGSQPLWLDNRCE